MEVGKLVFLEDLEKLRYLAELIYLQEVEAIQATIYYNNDDFIQSLTDSRTNYESVLKLVDTAVQLLETYPTNKVDKTTASAAKDFHDFIIYVSNFALQTMANYNSRLHYINEVTSYVESFVERMAHVQLHRDTLGTEMESIAIDAAISKNIPLQAAKSHQSDLSTTFSQTLKDSGIELHDLVQSHQARLGLEGPFEDLEPVQKAQVYNEIIISSGREAILVDQIKTVSKYGGAAWTVITVGFEVWDVFHSENKIEKSTYYAVKEVAQFGGAYLGGIVATAVATNVFELSPVYVTIAGIAGSIAGSFIVGAIVAALFGLIFSSGGEKVPYDVTSGHVSYVQDLPDGAGLANRIAFHLS
ncbi:uncharacterized protein LOC130781996 [Actinidia eriantha]|uniref:uncharacterized protein LOC130781996 n=1 Tax=Actinidia eriantha TaxID=165200 RepID=UPI002583D942|nr:uncharacterized protein LOC130781996 [Actinidia eriantha]